MSTISLSLIKKSHTYYCYFSQGFLRNLRGFMKCQSNQNADVLEAESCNSLIPEMKISKYMALPSELILITENCFIP